MDFSEDLRIVPNIELSRVPDSSGYRTRIRLRAGRLGSRCSVIPIIYVLMVFLVVGAAADEESSWFKPIKSGFAVAKNQIKTAGCRLIGKECCDVPFIRTGTAVSALRDTLDKEFFGQHLAVTTTLLALEAHLKDPNPGKALVLSFHGWAGSGKTYLTTHISKAFYEKGIESKHMKLFMASRHFPDPARVMEYKQLIQDEITGIVSQCPYALFVFDEVDKTPPGVFDAIVPFIEIPGRIDGVYYNKATFIFLSNSGSGEISNISLQAWQTGRKRESLTFKDFEKDIMKGTFNNIDSGLFRSSIIDRVLVDYFIPFLPMEKRHILKCVEMEAFRQGANVDAEAIADSLDYWPSDIKLFSTTGCKRVEGAVKYAVEEQRMRGRTYGFTRVAVENRERNNEEL